MGEEEGCAVVGEAVVGDSVVGDAVVGEEDGWAVGLADGLAVGNGVGEKVGYLVGVFVGADESVGSGVGAFVTPPMGCQKNAPYESITTSPQLLGAGVSGVLWFHPTSELWYPP